MSRRVSSRALSDPSGYSWLDRTWDRVGGEGSFNRTFGDRGSAWSDRNFGSGVEVTTGNLYESEATPGTSYNTYKSKNIKRNNDVYEMDGLANGDGVIAEAASYALDIGLAYKAIKWGIGLVKGGSELASEALPRIFTSSDPLFGDLANQIERTYPGHVIGVNVPVRNAAGGLVTDADIQLRNAIIQVKSGGGKGLAGQLLRTEQATGIPTIGYGPTLKPSVVRSINQAGGLVATDKGILIEVIRP